jgi:hypothetical protein
VERSWERACPAIASFGLVVAFGQMLVLELDVIAGTVREKRPLLVSQRPRLLHRAAHVQVTTLQALAGRHQAAGTDDHLVLDHRAIHDGAAHANQNPATQGTAMQHDLVTDGHFVTYDQWKAIGVERPGMGDVQHAAILHAGARANADAVHVAADHRQRPDRAVFTDLHIPQHHRRTVDKSAWSNFRSVLLEVSNGHDSASLDCQ